MILTAAEDGDVRIWDGRTGALLSAVHAHQGRGTWCLCVVSPTAIASGGGDCALKLWNLPDWLPAPHAALLLEPLCADDIRQPPTPPASAADVAAADTLAGPAALQATTCMPEELRARGERAARIHSTSYEGLCALALAGMDRLYAATSAGRLLQIQLRISGGSCLPEWREACDVAAGGMHLSCCAALPLPVCTRCTQHTDAADVVVSGSRQGTVTVVRVPVATPERAEVVARWRASPAAALISVYLIDSLPAGHVLCSCSDGRLWWLHAPALLCGCHAPAALGDRAPEAPRTATACGWAAINPKHRISAVEVLPDAGLLIVGDSVGGITAFTVPAALMHACNLNAVTAALAAPSRRQRASDADAESGSEGASGFAAAARFGRAHGAAPVTMVAAAAEFVYTGGRDGAPLHGGHALSPAASLRQLSCHIIHAACTRTGGAETHLPTAHA